MKRRITQSISIKVEISFPRNATPLESSERRRNQSRCAHSSVWLFDENTLVYQNTYNIEAMDGMQSIFIFEHKDEYQVTSYTIHCVHSKIVNSNLS